MKKFLLFAAALCFSATMFAQDVFTDSQGLYYEVILDDDGNATETCQIIATQGEAYEGEITIPETINGYTVTRIDYQAFLDSQIEGELTIPGTILNLGGNCFGNCTGLSRVTFEYGETALYDENATAYASAFNGCDNITAVLLDRDVDITTQSAVVAAFAYVQGIQTVYVGEHVTYIPKYMFRSNRSYVLSTVYSDAATPPSIDGTVFDNHTLGDFIFYTKADYLNTYKADVTWSDVFNKSNMHAYDGDDPEEPGNENAFQDEQGLWYEPIFDEDGNATENCQMIAPPAQADGQIYSGEITIPAEVNGYNVTRVDTYAFSGSEISGTLTIPANITNVGPNAFKDCTQLKHVIYEYAPDALYDEASGNNTGDESFTGCSGIEWVEMYRDITVGRDGYLCAPFTYHTAINTVMIGEAVTYIPGYMFRNTSGQPLTWVTCYATTPPGLGAAPFANLNADAVLYVYNDYISAYEDEDEGWGAVGFSAILPIEGVEEGITEVATETSTKTAGTYNLAGQRVSDTTKGLLIKDGKKVLVK